MQVVHHARLVEQVVFDRVRSAAAANPTLVRHYDRDRERAYREPAGPRRDALDAEIHRRWFEDLGFERPLVESAREAALTGPDLPPIFVHGVASALDEGSDVFERDGRRTIVLAVRAVRYRDSAQLRRFFRHEFRLVADLLDPAFGFSGGFRSGPGDVPPTLARDRYRLLWKTSADGRLARAGFAGLRSAEEWRSLVDRAFAFLPQEARAATFERLWSGPRPAHADLVNWSEDPRHALAPQLDKGDHVGRPAPGDRCPLCGFPTFDWHPDPRDLPPSLRRSIAARHSDWDPAAGACAACLERYELAFHGAFGKS